MEIRNPISKKIVWEVFRLSNCECHYCHLGIKAMVMEKNYPQIDHKIPISRGGGNEIENLVLACRRCNNQKRDMTPQEFAAWKQGKKDAEYELFKTLKTKYEDPHN